MATLRSLAVAAFVAVAAFGSVALGMEPQPAALPRNVFENDPFSRRYYAWWRPYKVIFDVETVLGIQKQIEAVPEEEASTVDFDEAFRENRHSAFLSPILATHGERGTVILERLLGEYEGVRELDDEWLLIVASLGRIPTARAEAILEAESDRVLKGELWKPRRKSRLGLSKPDARIALIDALLGCKAGQGALKAGDIEALCARARELTWITWTLGLEWARQLMPKEALLDILEKAFAGCDDADLAKAAAFEVASERLRAVQGFLGSAKDVWALTREFVLEKRYRRKAVWDYLRLLYCTVLMAEADHTRGRYSLDAEVVSFMTAAHIAPSRALSYCCKVLLSCQPSERNQEWEGFLASQAAHLADQDSSLVDGMVRRIHGPQRPEEQGVYDRPIRPGRADQPGVHLYGFRGGLR